jgi:hypothetical protein
MRNEEIIVLGLAGLALWFIMKGHGGSSGTAHVSTSTYTRHAAPDYQGWQYFTDGTAISPQGIYYQNGVEIWRP